MRYTAEQLKIIRNIKRIGRKRGESRSHILAALETGRVESNFQNLHGGDADSEGWRQERASLYKNPTHVKTSINRFYNEADQLDHGQSAGELAADVQRPRAEYRGRYALHAGEAKKLLHSKASKPGRGAKGGQRYSLTARGGEIVPGQAPRIIPGGTKVDKKAALVSALLDPRKKMGLLDRYQDAVATGAYTTTTPTKVSPGKGTRFQQGDKITVTGKTAGGDIKKAMHLAHHGDAPTGLRHLKGVVDFEGHKVAAWIAPMLTYARKHGWTGGINSGYRSDAEQTRIYNSGVRPAAVPRSLGGGGSNHEFKAYPGGAVDVSEAAQLSQILAKSPYAHVLVWAGAKDPVHFSHPHNGSY